jgi:diguanylate cyclase (GGDEF)-like protein
MFNRFFANWSKPLIFLFCLALVVAIAGLDYLSGPEFAFSIFYLPPIVLLTWYVGRVAGIFVALLSALCWISADLLSGHVYTNSVAPYWNTGVRLGFFVITLLLVGQLRKQLHRLRDLAFQDSLTGAANSRKFYLVAERECARARRSKKPMTLVYLDLDNFKTVNDTFGHPKGDELLEQVATTMQQHVRETDLVVRLGGDEFALFLPETNQEQAKGVLERVQTHLLKRMREQSYPVTFSIGAVTFLGPPTEVKDMVRQADELMYQVKGESKNALRFEVVPS